MNRLGLLALLILCYLLSLLAPLRWLWAVVANPGQAFEILKGYDLLGNPLFNGDAGEYISSRAYRASQEQTRWGCILCKFLDRFEKDHCKKSPIYLAPENKS